MRAKSKGGSAEAPETRGLAQEGPGWVQGRGRPACAWPFCSCRPEALAEAFLVAISEEAVLGVVE